MGGKQEHWDDTSAVENQYNGIKYFRNWYSIFRKCFKFLVISWEKEGNKQKMLHKRILFDFFCEDPNLSGSAWPPPTNLRGGGWEESVRVGTGRGGKGRGGGWGWGKGCWPAHS